ncbi:VOC family protein [Acetobacterium tundrae]|uniref:VOC family protein n=1 Tax=Acetobacterium tundrae TaxID=132932 RepID=A0ABR6WQ76_9FIRM|nr:VOC family protein [Acetobacterium tundrae]MBC3798577.1 VOC family protein [Acetobacterium tundrae]
MNLSWVTLTVKNIDESLNFYTEVVGLTLASRRPAGPQMELAFLGDGETKLELVCNQAVTEFDMGQSISLGFAVASVDETMAALQEKGIAIHSGPFQPAPYIRFFFITDPNGLKIQLIEHLA